MAQPLRARIPVCRSTSLASMGGAVALVAEDQGRKSTADPARHGAALARHLRPGGLWFLAHTIPWFSGPTSIDYKPTDNPKTLELLQRSPVPASGAADMGYGLVDLMDAARESAARVHVPYLMLHGLGDRIVPQQPVKAAIKIMPRRSDSQARLLQGGLSPAAARQGRQDGGGRRRGLDRRSPGAATLRRRGGAIAA